MKRTVETALGAFTLWASDTAVLSIDWGDRDGRDDTPLLREASAQLSAYAEGRLQIFDLPLAPKGGPLQQAVMVEMQKIPFGETVTYGDIAKTLGIAAQPVGRACGANPIPVIIPCHRVTGATGLGGFSGAGGVETKVQLLRHEGAYSLLI